MSRTPAQGLAFVRESRFSLEKFYEVIVVRRQALKRISQQIEDLVRKEEDEHKWFMDWGQWEDNTNHVFGQYMRRVEQMTAQRNALQAGNTRKEALDALLAEAGATENSIGISAGAVLQVAKQALSYRYGAKSSIPNAGVRTFGTQNVIELVWEGRNHAMHWEEVRPTGSYQRMLSTLQVDGLLTVRAGENHAVDLLDILEWRTAQALIHDLELLVQL